MVFDGADLEGVQFVNTVITGEWLRGGRGGGGLCKVRGACQASGRAIFQHRPSSRVSGGMGLGLLGGAQL